MVFEICEWTDIQARYSNVSHICTRRSDNSKKTVQIGGQFSQDFAQRRESRCIVQEAQPSPRDRALANCHATVQKLLIRQVLTKLMAWSWRFSRRQCVRDNVHSTMTRPSQVSQTNRRRSSCVYHLYTDDLLWRSPQCRNCSRDPHHAHFGSTHSSQD